MSKLESSNVEVQELSDDSTEEAGSDSEVYEPTVTSEEGAFEIFFFFVIVVMSDKSSVKAFFVFYCNYQKIYIFLNSRGNFLLEKYNGVLGA